MVARKNLSRGMSLFIAGGEVGSKTFGGGKDQIVFKGTEGRSVASNRF